MPLLLEGIVYAWLLCDLRSYPIYQLDGSDDYHSLCRLLCIPSQLAVAMPVEQGQGASTVWLPVQLIEVNEAVNIIQIVTRNPFSSIISIIIIILLLLLLLLHVV